MKSLKISDELHKRIKTAAASEGRSLQDYLSEIVEIHLSNDPEVIAILERLQERVKQKRSDTNK